MRKGVLVLALAASASVRAQQTDPAYEVFNKGILLFQQGAYRAAREQFVEAIRLRPDKPNPHFYLGITEAKLGDCAGALFELEYYFKTAPAAHPHYAEATTTRDQCRQAVKPTTGVLVVESDPSGADVRLDDERAAPLGTTPLRNDAASIGEHKLFLTRDGFAAETRSITIVADRETSLRVLLTPVPAPAVTATPASEPAVTAPASATPTPVDAMPAHRRKARTGVIIGVVGVAVVGLAVGLGVGLTAHRDASIPKTALGNMMVTF